MGQTLIKNYTLEKDPYLTGGYKNFWKIYKGTHKIRETLASVFVFDKKVLDQYSNKDEKEEILLLLRKESQNLQKFKHPGILGIQEQLIEDKTSLAFVTEYIPHSISSWIGTGMVSRLEVKLIFIELIEVFRFLEEDAKVIHTNISPDSIFLDEKGKIKVSGFNFPVIDPPQSGGESQMLKRSTYPNAYPDLYYSSPEAVNPKEKVTYKSDVFGLGLLASHILNKISKNPKEGNFIESSSNTPEGYKRMMEGSGFSSRKRMFFDNLITEEMEFIEGLLIKDQNRRESISRIKENKWFSDFKLNALTFIDNLEANEKGKNTLFLTQFPNLISQFDEKIIKKKILPKLIETMQLETFMNLVIPCVIAIAENKEFDINFETVIWPILKNVIFKMKQMPAATLYFLITKADFIGNHISKEEFTNHMLNIICKALDCGVTKIQTAVIENINSINKKIDSQAYKNQVFQRFINIMNNTTSNELLILILKNIKLSLSLLDKSTINDTLLNSIEKLRKQDNKLQTCICLVDIYEEISSHAKIESIANKVLPNLIAILVSGEISSNLFNRIMTLVQTYLDKIHVFRQKDFTSENEINKSNTNQLSSSIGNISEGNKQSNDDFLSMFFQSNSGNSKNNENNNKLMYNENAGLGLGQSSKSDSKSNDFIDFGIINQSQKTSAYQPQPQFNNNKNQQNSKINDIDFSYLDDDSKKRDYLDLSNPQSKPIIKTITNNKSSSSDVNYDEFFNKFDDNKKKDTKQTNKSDFDFQFDDFPKTTQQVQAEVKKDPFAFDFSGTSSIVGSNLNKKVVSNKEDFGFDFSSSQTQTNVNNNGNNKNKKKNELEDLLNF